MKIKHSLFIFSLGILSITGVYAGQTLGDNLTTSATCSVSSKTNSVTTTASTTVLLVPVVHHAGADTVSVTFNGVALSLYHATTSGGIDLEAWALSSPPVGTYNLVTTVNSSAYCIAHGAYVIKGSASSTTLLPIISTRSQTSTNFSWSVTTNQVSTSTRTYVFGVAQSGATINATGDTQMDSQPEVSAFGTFMMSRVASVFADTVSLTGNASNQNYITIAFTLQDAYTAPPTPVTTQDIVVSASLYDQTRILYNPATTTAYTFTSPRADTTLKQGGIVTIVHSSTTFPVITWGSNTMTLLKQSASQVTGYVTSIFFVATPASLTNITVSNITSGTVRFVHASTFSNGNLSATSDEYAVVSSSQRAWIDLATTKAPITVVGALHTSQLAGFSRLDGTLLTQSTTTSNGDIGIFRGVCSVYGILNDCPVGYNFNWALGSANGTVVGVALYSTSTPTYTSTSTISLGIMANSTTTQSIFDTLSNTDLGTSAGFSSCFSDVFQYSVLSTAFYGNLASGMVCSLQNMVYWVVRLLLPDNNQLESYSAQFTQSINDRSPATAVFSFIYYLYDLSSTTTPVGVVQNYSFAIPTSIFGGTYTLGTQPIKIISGYVSTTTDATAKNWLSPFFAVFFIMFTGYFMLKLLH